MHGTAPSCLTVAQCIVATEPIYPVRTAILFSRELCRHLGVLRSPKMVRPREAPMTKSLPEPSSCQFQVASPVVLLWLALVSACLTLAPPAAASELPPSVRLAHGSIGAFQWEVVVRHEKKPNPRRPCIEVAFDRADEGKSGAEVCGPLVPVPTLLAHSSGNGRFERTALALAFPASVKSVRLWIRGHKSRRINLRMLGPRQARRARVARFRYAAEGFAGPFCLRRYATYDESGDLITTSPSTPCQG
jgi:hypothetical protein